MHGPGGSGTTQLKLLLLGCGVYQPRRASESRQGRYFLGFAAGFLFGFRELRVVRSRLCAAAVDGVVAAAAAADDDGGGGGGWIP